MSNKYKLVSKDHVQPEPQYHYVYLLNARGKANWRHGLSIHTDASLAQLQIESSDKLDLMRVGKFQTKEIAKKVDKELAEVGPKCDGGEGEWLTYAYADRHTLYKAFDSLTIQNSGVVVLHVE